MAEIPEGRTLWGWPHCVQDAAMTGYLLEVKRRFFGSQLMDFDL